MIDLRRLRVLRAVAHYGTVTAAAQALHFTPSAASQQLRKLEQDLGVELLQPDGRGVRLTTAARSLLSHADEIAARWEQAEAELRSIGDQPVGSLRVSGFPTAVAALLSPMVAALRRSHPRLTVELREDTETSSRDSFDLLFAGEVDLAVTAAVPDNPPTSDSRFEQHHLLDDPFDLVVPADHPMVGRPDASLAQAADEPWILPPTDSTCRVHTLSACSAAGFTPNVVHHAVESNAVAHLVAQRLGVALVPRLAPLPPHLPIRRVACDGNPTRKLLTCTRAGGHAHPAVAAAVAELRRTAPTVAVAVPAA